MKDMYCIETEVYKNLLIIMLFKKTESENTAEAEKYKFVRNITLENPKPRDIFKAFNELEKEYGIDKIENYFHEKRYVISQYILYSLGFEPSGYVLDETLKKYKDADKLPKVIHLTCPTCGSDVKFHTDQPNDLEGWWKS